MEGGATASAGVVRGWRTWRAQNTPYPQLANRVVRWSERRGPRGAPGPNPFTDMPEVVQIRPVGRHAHQDPAGRLEHLAGDLDQQHLPGRQVALIELRDVL